MLLESEDALLNSDVSPTLGFRVWGVGFRGKESPATYATAEAQSKHKDSS